MAGSKSDVKHCVFWFCLGDWVASINVSIIQLICYSFNKLINMSIDQLANQYVNWSTSHSICQSISMPSNTPINISIIESANQCFNVTCIYQYVKFIKPKPINMSINESQTIKLSINHSIFRYVIRQLIDQ